MITNFGDSASPAALEPSVGNKVGKILQGLRRHLRDPQLRVALAVIMTYTLAAISAHWWVHGDPIAQDLASRLHPPNWVHPFGTDELGRDVFSRVVFGAQISIPAALVVILCGSTFGTGLGAVAGFVGGALDEVILRITDMVLAFPVLVLTIAIGAAFGAGLTHGVIALIVVWWPQYVRVCRGLVLDHKTRDYVAASVAAGQRAYAVLLRVILPNTLPTIAAMAAIDVGRAILLFSILGFVGVGARPPAPEWGSMVAEGATVFDQWWVATFPALAILVLVFAFNLVGDALGDVMDPWSAGRN
jgi:peptide/nickel transport system permease protein